MGNVSGNQSGFMHELLIKKLIVRSSGGTYQFFMVCKGDHPRHTQAPFLFETSEKVKFILICLIISLYLQLNQHFIATFVICYTMKSEMIVTFGGGKKVNADFNGFTIETDQSSYAGGDDSAQSHFLSFLPQSVPVQVSLYYPFARAGVSRLTKSGLFRLILARNQVEV